MLEDLLSNIDLLGIPVALNLFGREKAKTRFGGLCSTLLFGFVIWAIYNASQELFSAANPKIVSYQYYRDDPDAIIINRQNFPIAIAMQASDVLNLRPYRDSSLFTLQVSHLMIERTYTATGEAVEKRTTSKIYMENCTKDYFDEQASSLGSLNLNAGYCISKEQPELDKLEIEGVYSSQVYQAIIAEVIMCDNSTSNNTCAPEEKVNQYLNGGWFNMFYVNMVVNPQNYSNPNNTYKDVYYTKISPYSSTVAEVYLGTVDISTDSGWLTEEFHNKTYIKVSNVKESLHSQPHPKKMLIRCILRASQLETYYTRSYKKVQNVIAEAAALSNIALVIVVIITAPFMKIKFREAIMNELFDVQIPKSLNNKKAEKKSGFSQTKKGRKDLTIKTQKTCSTENNHLVLRETNFKSDVMTDINNSPRYEGDGRELEVRLNSLASPLPSETRALFDSSRLKMTRKNEVIGNETVREYNKKDVMTTNEDLITKRNEAQVIEKNQKGLKLIEEERQEIKLPQNKKNKTGSIKPMTVSLRDENSLHLSFSSESEGSDLESPKKDDVKDREVTDVVNVKESEIKTTENNIVQNKVEQIEIKGNITKTPRKNSSFMKKITKIFRSGDQKKMDISLWQYISWLIWIPNSQKRKKKVFEEGLRQVNERLDIINVMKKLRELDKFRALLLNPDQLLLFNNMPKPIIQHETDYFKKNRMDSYTRLQSLRFADEANPVDQIKITINKIKSKGHKTEIDRRLIEIFEGKNFSGA